MDAMTWVRGARPQTLPLGLAPVLVGAALSWSWVMRAPMGGSQFHAPCPTFGGRPPYSPDGEQGICVTSWQWFLAVTVLCAVVAVGLQVAANYINDYADGIRGADNGRGGSEKGGDAPTRLVASGVDPRSVLLAAGIAAAVACTAGLGVVALTGNWWFVVLGAICLAAAWAYTGGRHPYGYAGLGEAAAFVFFGLVPTLGTQVALMDGIQFTGLVGATMCGCFAAAVMMVNNLRDVDADLAHGKRTLMTRLGSWHGTTLYRGAMMVGVMAMLLRTVPSLVALPRDANRCHAMVVADARYACLVRGLMPMAVLELAAAVFTVLAVLTGVRAARALTRRRFAAALPLTSKTALLAALAVAGTALF